MQDNRIRESLGYALVRAFRLVNRASTRALLPHGLSAEQAHILLVLWGAGSMKVGELQKTLALGSGTLTGALDRMTKSGLVRRKPSPSDGRAFVVEPAPFEERKRKKIERALEEMERRAFEVLSAREQKELFRMLSKIAEAIGDE